MTSIARRCGSLRTISMRRGPFWGNVTGPILPRLRAFPSFLPLASFALASTTGVEESSPTAETGKQGFSRRPALRIHRERRNARSQVLGKTRVAARGSEVSGFSLPAFPSLPRRSSPRHSRRRCLHPQHCLHPRRHDLLRLPRCRSLRRYWCRCPAGREAYGPHFGRGSPSIPASCRTPPPYSGLHQDCPQSSLPGIVVIGQILAQFRDRQHLLVIHGGEFFDAVPDVARKLIGGLPV